MYTEIIYDNLNDKLTVPEKMGTPKKHHLLGSNLDNLVEICGRVCYDSMKSEKSRNSYDYHKHIAEVKHQSVQEHANIVVQIDIKDDDTANEYLFGLMNRPGIFVVKNEGMDSFKIVFNLRAAREWFNYSNEDISPAAEEIVDNIGHIIRKTAFDRAPLVMFDCVPEEANSIKYDHKIIEPSTDEEIWISIFIDDCSRGFTHELVRHGDWTAISQRSTRFVDESESDWAWHPLIKQWTKKPFKVKFLEWYAKYVYKYLVNRIQPDLEYIGLDKFTARKQARGAARGALGNALSTQLVFSANLAQWKRILDQRGSSHADAEIREFANQVYLLLKNRFPDRMKMYNTVSCDDGVDGVAKYWTYRDD